MLSFGEYIHQLHHLKLVTQKGLVTLFCPLSWVLVWSKDYFERVIFVFSKDLSGCCAKDRQAGRAELSPSNQTRSVAGVGWLQNEAPPSQRCTPPLSSH